MNFLLHLRFFVPFCLFFEASFLPFQFQIGQKKLNKTLSFYASALPNQPRTATKQNPKENPQIKKLSSSILVVLWPGDDIRALNLNPSNRFLFLFFSYYNLILVCLINFSLCPMAAISKNFVWCHLV